jgi:hydrogenase expression/formation protein HypC
MCLGIPMQVVDVANYEARCEARGIERRVNLFLLQDEPIQPGDHVLVHIGYAIQKLDEDDAKDRWEVLEQMIEMMPELAEDTEPDHA